MNFKVGDRVKLNDLGKSRFPHRDGATITEVCDPTNIYDYIINFTPSRSLIVFSDEIERFDMLKPRQHIKKHEF